MAGRAVRKSQRTRKPAGKAPAKARDLLTKYKRMRDFSKTPEPSGGIPKKRKFPSFVIQKHAATRLHYDFRLEVDGVLKSWAVPKGPSFDPKVRRLAVPTEDHPMDYAGFEGNIPKGEYGGGSVIVWDRGYYVNVSQKNGRTVPIREALEKGHATIWMEGEKVKGGFSLIRLHGRDEGGKTPWLLVKSEDTKSDPSNDPVAAKTRSVLSGRTVEEVARNKK